MSAAREVVGASGAAVAIERGGVLERAGASGEFDPEMVPEGTPVEDEGSLAEAFRTGGSLWMEPRPGWKDKEARERWAFVPLVGRGGPMGVLALCCPEDAYAEEDRSLLETMVWQAGQALERARLVDSEARGRDRLARVLAVSDAALGWLDSDEALAGMLRRIREAVNADSVSLLVREGEVLRVRATDGLERIPEEQVLIPVGQGFSGRIAAERHRWSWRNPRFQVVSPWSGNGCIRSSGCPSSAATTSSVCCMRARRLAELRAEDVELLTLVATRVGGALERAQLFAAARTAQADASRAADRLRRLQTATAAFTGAVTVEEVSEAILHEAIAAVHADAGVLAVPSSDGTKLDIVAIRGRQPTDGAFPPSFPVDADTAICAAFRSGEAVWVPSREEWERRYPDGLGITKPWARSILAVPMRLEEDRKLGAIGLLFKSEGRLGRDERRLAKTFADQGALALERARLFEAERAARDLTERKQTFAASLAAAATTRRCSRSWWGRAATSSVRASPGLPSSTPVRRSWMRSSPAGTRRRDRTVPPDVARYADPGVRRRARTGRRSGSTRSRISTSRIPHSRCRPTCTAAGSGACRCSTRPAGLIGVASFQLGPRSAPDGRGEPTCARSSAWRRSRSSGHSSTSWSGRWR